MNVDVDMDEEESLPSSPMSIQDGIRAVQQAFTQASPPPRWPLYVRQAKQYLRTMIDGFDERKYGFASVVDLLRAAGKEGVLRIERDRQGAIRVFPGANLTRASSAPPIDDGQMSPVELDETVDVEVPAERINDVVEGETIPMEAVTEPPIVDGETLGAAEEEPRKPVRKRKTASARPPRAAKAAVKTARPRARKSAARDL
jgi:hypothetical protein